MMRIAGAALAVLMVAGCGTEDGDAACLLPYTDHLDRTCYVDAVAIYTEEGVFVEDRPYLFCDGPCIPWDGGTYCGTEMVGLCYQTREAVGNRCMTVGDWFCRRFP